MKSLFSNDSITESARPDQYSLDTDFSEHDPRFRVEYYSNEKSIKEKLRYYFIQNKTTSRHDIWTLFWINNYLRIKQAFVLICSISSTN